ncbi:hypothetical protein [Gymnodinialimonas ceratoperidinii]|uniref:Uncharacterized protein n=1 Tax=Gymnodinialimonas ceratoperidinii TaxID=2856823 RepID=A0A8F6U0T7_9RHOB|nr:hypothetical protein [Gymnodinialimonas ceratoperidinii]QXT41493.1 hypothetical protein KYE46_13290 [Gymnodinialimonas ceratoperidinii]
MTYRRFIESDDGAVTIDWLTTMAVMVGLGVAISESTGGALTEHSGNVHGELQGGQFETAWDANLVVQPVLEEDPCDINGNNGNGNGNGNGNNDYEGECYGNNNGNNGWGNGDQDAPGGSGPNNNAENSTDPDRTDPTAGNQGGAGTTDPDPDPDPQPDPDPDPQPDPDPDPGSQQAGADGCPTSALSGTEASGTGRGMYSADRYAVTAGGPTSLSSCGSHNYPSDVGYFTAAPSFTFNLSGLQGYERVEIETLGRGNCDTVLLVRDSHGNWYHDDDSGSGRRSKINLTDMTLATGRVDVWVGMYGDDSCNVTLEMETW